MRLLVVAAHPDDEVLGCGGTIARLAAQGDEVSILILGEGVTSRHDDPAQADPAQITALHNQARAVGASLGASEVALAGLPDNRFDTLPLLEIVKKVEAEIDRVEPEVVYTQHGGDLNIDHAMTFRAVLTATRPVANSSVRRVLAYEVGSSTEWSFQSLTPPFRPNVFSDIGATLDKKLAAMAMYAGEARAFPHPRSPEAIEAAARRWGSVAGLVAAEAFELIRHVE